MKKSLKRELEILFLAWKCRYTEDLEVFGKKKFTPPNCGRWGQTSMSFSSLESTQGGAANMDVLALRDLIQCSQSYCCQRVPVAYCTTATKNEKKKNIFPQEATANKKIILFMIFFLNHA